MAFQWEEEAAREGGGQTPKIPTGTHAVSITRTLRCKKDGEEFASQAGDPQLMVIFSDAQGREAGLMVTLSDKAGFVLAKLMSAAGANLKRMQEVGVTPQHFARAEFAAKQLVGRKLYITVEWKENAKYPDITPVRPEAASAAPAAGGAADELETIPF